jgi:hypothetical protein
MATVKIGPVSSPRCRLAIAAGALRAVDGGEAVVAYCSRGFASVVGAPQISLELIADLRHVAMDTAHVELGLNEVSVIV